MSDPQDAPKTPGGILSESADKLLKRAPRPRSAQEALAAARAAEARQAPKKPDARRDTQPEQEVNLPEPDGDVVVAVLRQLVADAVVLKRTNVRKRDVFRAVWQSHAARARLERNLTLAINADTLIHAAGQVEDGHLWAVEVALGTERVAAWVDTHSETVLACASPPALYLIG